MLSVLVAGALIASVVAPAHESGRVLALLDDDRRLIEPARLALRQIEAGVTRESAALERFNASRDVAALRRARAATTQVDAALRTLLSLTAQLDGPAGHEADSLVRLVGRWRQFAVDSVGTQGGRARRDSMTAHEAIRDSIVTETERVHADLAGLALEWRANLADHERRGLLVNAILVSVAFIAIVGALELTRRELRRGRREAALRLAAETFADAFTAATVRERVAKGAVELLRGASARVIVDPTLQHTGPTIISDAGAAQPRSLLIPLGSESATTGVFVTVEESSRHRFTAEDLSWAGTLSHLASLAIEKVRLLEEARDGRQRLERAMDSRGRLMRGFSHDVKNPLGAADGYAALLRDGIYGTVTEEQGQSIDRIRKAIHRALTLIDDLHELARAETGKLVVRPERASIGALVVMIGDEYRAAAEARHLTLVADVQSDLPDVETDPSRIRQVIGNLLSNAIKYTEFGAVTLRARLSGPTAAGPALVVVDVIDTGPGIPPDKMELIFEEFERLDTGKSSGAGLGLAISRRVADAIGCQIHVESLVGRGSTFSLRIPIGNPAISSPRTENSASVEGVGG